MIFGRPTNLILGAFTALFNVVVLGLAAAGTVLDGQFVAAVNIAAAAVIALIAGQPPTVTPGSEVHVQTPGNGPNKSVKV